MADRVDSLIERLERAADFDRVESIRQLGETGDARAVDALIALLERSLGDWNRRFVVTPAIHALGRLGSRRAEEVLLKALHSNLFFVKSEAARALGQLAIDGEVVEELKAVLHGAENAMVKKSAAEGLARIGKSEALSTLVEEIQKDPDIQVKKRTIQSLGDARSEEALSRLIDLYHQETNDKLRLEVIKASSRIPATASEELLLEALDDSNPRVRSRAALALGEMRSKSGERELRNLLSDPEKAVRESAAQALGMITFLP